MLDTIYLTNRILKQMKYLYTCSLAVVSLVMSCKATRREDHVHNVIRVHSSGYIQA